MLNQLQMKNVIGSSVSSAEPTQHLADQAILHYL